MSAQERQDTIHEDDKDDREEIRRAARNGASKNAALSKKGRRSQKVIEGKNRELITIGKAKGVLDSATGRARVTVIPTLAGCVDPNVDSDVHLFRGIVSSITASIRAWTRSARHYPLADERDDALWQRSRTELCSGHPKP